MSYTEKNKILEVKFWFSRYTSHVAATVEYILGVQNVRLLVLWMMTMYASESDREIKPGEEREQRGAKNRYHCCPTITQSSPIIYDFSRDMLPELQ